MSTYSLVSTEIIFFQPTILMFSFVSNTSQSCKQLLLKEQLLSECGASNEALFLSATSIKAKFLPEADVAA